MQNTSRRAVFINLTSSILFICLMVFFCSGCVLDERQARQNIDNGVRIESDLPISCSNPMMGTEIDAISKQVVEGMSLDELKRKIESLDKDLVVIKDVFGKADKEYGKVLKLSGATDWVKHAHNLMRVHELVIEIDEKALTMFHSYLSSVEAGAPVDFQSMVLQCAKDISPLGTEFTEIGQEMNDYLKQEGDE